MAVFKQQLNWKTIQDNQLKALLSLQETCSNSFNIQKDIYDILDNKIFDAIYDSSTNVIASMNLLFNNREFKDFRDSVQLNQENLNTTIDELKDSDEEFKDELSEGFDNLSDDLENIGDGISELQYTIISRLKEFTTNVVKYSLDSADRWTRTYNDTIKYIGVDGTGAQKFREDLIHQVDDLSNSVSAAGIGGKFSPQEALNTMLAISNSTDISNMKSLKNLLEPILLAQETTNLNIQGLAEIGNRFYVRYNFNSRSLEGIVSHIRDLSENNNVSEERLLQATSEVETRLGLLYSGDQSSLDSAIKSMTKGLAWLENSGIDYSSFVNDLNTLLGDNTLAKRDLMVKYSGGDYETIMSQIESGDFSKVLETMFKSVGRRGAIEAEEIFGINAKEADTARLVYELMNKGQIDTLDKFLEKLPKVTTDKSSTRERMEDKFVSVQDQIVQKMDGITQYLAQIQEKLGIGFGDIALILGVAGNTYAALGGASLLGGSGGLAGLLGSGNKGIAGLLSKSGPAIGIGAVAIALTGVVEGFYNAYDRMSKLEMENYQNTATNLKSLSEGQVADTKVEDVIDPKTGKISTKITMNATDAPQKTQEESLKDIEKARDKQKTEIYDSYDKSTWKTVVGFGKGDDWYDYIPGVGSVVEYFEKTGKMDQVDENAKFNADLLKFTRSLSEDDRILYNKYREKGLIPEQDIDKLKFFIQNFNKFKELSSEGLASEVSEEGLKNPRSRESLLGYKEGTNFIPDDQLAYLHRGEAVIPAKYNPANNMNELEKLRKEKDNSDNDDLLVVVRVLSEIKEFIKYWKQDTDMKETISRGKNTYMNSLSRFQVNA